MPNILCFGDSNTFGTNPAGGRWPRRQRWTGILQEKLGMDFYIIEEGLGGRTTVLDDPLEGDKNGRTHLSLALHSHRPLDMVVLMLGTNDMKHRFSLLPADVAAGAALLGRLVQTYDYGPGYPIPQVLLISPIHLGEEAEHSVYTGFSAGAVEVSKKLAPLYRAHAEANGWLFLDAAAVAKPSPRDMLHMEADSHQALADAVESIIRDHF